jgi:hypothetical protein
LPNEILRHIPKKDFPFFVLFRAHLQLKFTKSANKSKKNCNQNFNMGIKKAEFHADFESGETVIKNAPKKVISKNVTEICTIFTFTHVRQTCFAYV